MSLTLWVFLLVHLGLLLGRLPWLALDRTGIPVTLLTLAVAAGWIAWLA